MEDLCLRFPGVCDMVLSHLDNQSLMRCKISSRELCRYLDENERCIFKRIIKKYASGQNGFSQCWKRVIYRAPIDILKQLATAVIQWKKWSYYRCGEKVQWSPLHIVAEQGRLPLVKHVHERIFDKNPTDSGLLAAMSPLHLVAKNQDLDVCNFLINEAIDVSPRGGIGKETPLHSAARQGRLKFFQLLFERLDNKFPEDFCGSTPYHTAARCGRLEICKFVFANTKNKNPANIYGQTPMHLAAQSGQLEVLRFLMKNIKDKNPRDDVGNTPLHHAARCWNYVQVSKLICNSGGDQKPLNNRGETPDDLHTRTKDLMNEWRSKK